MLCFLLDKLKKKPHSFTPRNESEANCFNLEMVVPLGQSAWPESNLSGFPYWEAALIFSVVFPAFVPAESDQTDDRHSLPEAKVKLYFGVLAVGS